MFPGRTFQRGLLLFSSASKAVYEAGASLFPQDSICRKSKPLDKRTSGIIPFYPHTRQADGCLVRWGLHIVGTWQSAELPHKLSFFYPAPKETPALINELK